jgi:hypothetical protein
MLFVPFYDDAERFLLIHLSYAWRQRPLEAPFRPGQGPNRRMSHTSDSGRTCLRCRIDRVVDGRNKRTPVELIDSFEKQETAFHEVLIRTGTGIHVKFGQCP